MSAAIGIDPATIRMLTAQLDKGEVRTPVVSVNDQGQMYVEGGPTNPIRKSARTKATFGS